MDAHGRVYYIDHINRKTTWQKPTESTGAEQTVPSNGLNEQREQFERRLVVAIVTGEFLLWLI